MREKAAREFLEPLFERVLGGLLIFSPLTHVKHRTHRLVEIYVLSWYVGSIVILVTAELLFRYTDRNVFMPVMLVFVILAAHRIFDCITANVQISLIEVLNAKGREDRLTSRNVLLLGINFFEFLNNFAIVFFCMSACGWVTFNGINTIVDSLYFSLSTLTTLGFGDIHPISMGAKLAVTAESLIGIIFLFIVLNVFVSTIQAARRRVNN